MARTTGRPRADGESPTGLGTREDILHVSADLFCTVGYGGTSTHTIARRAGIRQASVYHYFSGKHEILLALLLGTVQPSVETARRLLASDEPALHRLWALCVSDVRLLCDGEVNVGSLYLLPELTDERFAPFHALRDELEAAYRTLIASGAPPTADTAPLTMLVLGLVESVILQRRRSPGSIDAETPLRIADAALKVLDLRSDELEACRAGGTRLLH